MTERLLSSLPVQLLVWMIATAAIRLDAKRVKIAPAKKPDGSAPPSGDLDEGVFATVG